MSSHQLLGTNEEPCSSDDDPLKGSSAKGTQSLLQFQTELGQAFRYYGNRSGKCSQRGKNNIETAPPTCLVNGVY